MYDVEWEDDFGDKIYDLDEKASTKIYDGEDDVIDSQKEFADAVGLTLQ